MDFKEAERLLERYWQCETSLEEEAQLRDFFVRHDGHLPAGLLRYRDLFIYQQSQQEVRLGDDFDARVLAEVEPTVVKARRMTLRARLAPLFKAAAVVAVVFMLGNVVQHSFQSDADGVTAADTIGKQVSAPSVAFSEETAVPHEKQILDSLHRVDRQELRK